MDLHVRTIEVADEPCGEPVEQKIKQTSNLGKKRTKTPNFDYITLIEAEKQITQNGKIKSLV